MKNASNFIGGIIAGAAIGAALALLFAAAKGSDTRAMLKRKLEDMTQELKAMKSKLTGNQSEDLDEKIRQMEEKINNLTNQIHSDI